MSGLHFHPLRVQAVRADTDDAMVVSFDVPPALADTFRFQPGQYLTLRHVHDGQDLRRSYSICAATGETVSMGNSGSAWRSESCCSQGRRSAKSAAKPACSF